MFANEYEILEKMASGTFGIVFKVRRITDQQLFVMKRIPLLDLSAEQRRDAAQEIDVMRGLHHPCVVEQKDAFLFNGYDLCLILEYYDGGDMDTRMAAQREADTYFSFEQVMLWFVQLVLGAQYLHANHVVHRDIKTHNVFLREKDGSVSLGDFGISERFNTDAAMRTWREGTVGRRRGSLLSNNDGGDGFYAGGGGRGGGDCSPSRSGAPSLPAADYGTLIHPAALAPLPRTLSSSSAQFASGEFLDRPSQLANQHPAQQQQQQQQQLQLPSRLRRGSGPGSTFPGTPGSPWAGGKMAAAMKGTPLYMAPEVLQGGAASPQSDVWSLGCVLYELLALRHPFESRDLATLVMRVSRGQREPLPPHYPRPVQDVINRMLNLDAARRPTCEELLMVPCVRAYVELWRTLRVPLDLPTAPSEAALAAQLAAWATNVTAAVAANPHDPQLASLHHRDVQRQLMAPASLPSDEREATERRAAAAAREALLQAGPSLSVGSAASFTHAATGGVAEGTFFYGASGRGIAGDALPLTAAKNGEEGEGGGAAHGFGAGGMGPTESMRPHMLYDRPPDAVPDSPVSLSSAQDAAHCDDSPERSSAMAAKHRQQQQQQWGDGGSRVQSSHEERRTRDAAGGSPDPLALGDAAGGGPLPTTSPPPPLRSHHTSKALRTAGVRPIAPPVKNAHPLPPIDEDVLFFKEHRNVIDMRYSTVEAIAAAVVEMRQRVQQSMRHQRVLLDIEQLHSRHGSAPLHSMPNVLNVLATAAAASTEREKEEQMHSDRSQEKQPKQQRLSAPDTASGLAGSTASASTSAAAAVAVVPPDVVYAAMEQRIEEQRGGRERQDALDDAWAAARQSADGTSGQAGHTLPVGRPAPTRIRQLRVAAILAEAEAARERLQRLPSRGASRHDHHRSSAAASSATAASASLSAVALPFADPTAPLRVSQDAGPRSRPFLTSPLSPPRLLGSPGRPHDRRRSSDDHRWVAYVLRRNVISQALTRVFDPVSLRAVYAYYCSCPLLQRDARLVRRLVPDRSQWTALPMVEELVVLDRQLQPLIDATAGRH